MSRHVDVLAVMTRAAERLCIDGVEGIPAGPLTAADLLAARAAVAELAEAIKPLAALDLRPDSLDTRPDSQVIYARDKTQITVGDVRRAQVALAKFGGAA